MRHVIARAAAVAVMATQIVLAQAPMTPTVPGTAGDPVWQGKTRLSDGRTFITDGGLAIDAALARAAAQPDREFPGQVLEGYFNAPHKDECGLTDLRAAASGFTYTTPGGIALNATYINFLRRILPAAAVRLRTTTSDQPAVIMADGKAIGVLMPVKE